jgi:hypothetical protein
MKKPTAKASKMKRVTVYLVDVVEHDSWSGPALLHTKEFTSKLLADKYVHSYNSQNTKKVVPDYYISAEIVKTYDTVRAIKVRK